MHLNCAPSREHPHDSLIERVMYYLNHSTNKVQYVVPHIVTRLIVIRRASLSLLNMVIFITLCRHLK